MKFFLKIAFVCMLLFSIGMTAYANEVFLCMQSERSFALSGDSEGFLEYIQMTDSNGVVVQPKISGDGNTYLPLRFILETAGFDDANIQPDSERYFKFIEADPTVESDKPKIELFCNGEKIVHEVGVSFSYEVAQGDVRNVCIYNINGSLFFPVTYLKGLINAKAVFCPQTGDIIFATSGVELERFIEENGVILEDVIEKSMYYPYRDEDSKPGMYKLPSGEYGVINSAINDVYRIKNTVYWLSSEGKLQTMQLDTDATEHITFKDKNKQDIDVKISEFGIAKTKIYGINSENNRLFVSELSGNNFCYLTDVEVFNLRFSYHKGRAYVFYCDSEFQVHLIEVSTGDDYLVEITDYEHNNLLGSIKYFDVTKETFCYVDESNITHIIKLPDPLEEFEIARITQDNYLVVGEE